MSLQNYQQKRNFRKTPEPKGELKLMGKGPLRFVVHKHEASHLHYDLRLELDGVLKSWAVPKGIGLNPAERHLAVMVEDHPWDYRNFEGIIPEGNYGAGTVMIWDEGNYTAAGIDEREESEARIKRGLGEGHITFVLDGKKLKGEFVLIKLRRSEKNEWLLVKKGDRFATDKTLEERSAATGRTMNEISEAARKENFSWPNLAEMELPPEAKRSRVLHQIKPMAATLTEKPFDDENWFFEVKWDGYRTIAEVNRGGARLYSRNDLLLNKYFDQIGKTFEGFPGQAVLDGEIVAVDESGRSDFGRLQNYIKTGQGAPVYYVFDILFLNDHDLRAVPLWQRKEILKQVLPSNLPDIKYSEHVVGRGKQMFEFARQNRLEGILAKDSESVYRDGTRSREWLKIKNLGEQEAVIAGFTRPRGGRKHFGSLVLGVYEKKDLVYVGNVGGGFDDLDLAYIKKKLDKLIVKKSPFKKVPKLGQSIIWVKPELVCEIKFTEWTKDGFLRQPVFLGLREDKSPRQVIREIPAVETSPQKIKKDEGEMEVGNFLVRVSHLQKVFWPDEGYTKGDLINYYRAVSPLILPHLKDRPESLHRHPDGIKKQGFFQKDVNFSLPDWARAVPMHSETENKMVNYLVCQNEATLVLMANLGCIEINPWASRYQQPNRPDYLLFDLDPLDISFAKVVEAANVFREVLEKAGAEAYCKTSGATGLHICVPLGGKYDYEPVREFGRLVSRLVNNLIPDFTSVQRGPAKRKKCVYLDYLQNSSGQTMAAAYCVRPRTGAPVSTPLEWKEVGRKLDPAKFTIKTAPKRFTRKGDIWREILGKGTDIKKCLKNLEGAFPSFFGK